MAAPICPQLRQEGDKGIVSQVGNHWFKGQVNQSSVQTEETILSLGSKWTYIFSLSPPLTLEPVNHFMVGDQDLCANVVNFQAVCEDLVHRPTNETVGDLVLIAVYDRET